MTPSVRYSEGIWTVAGYYKNQLFSASARALTDAEDMLFEQLNRHKQSELDTQPVDSKPAQVDILA